MASSDHTGDHHGSGSFPADPMHQFEIKRLLDINIAGFDISFTNSALFMLIAVFIISFTTIISVRKNSIIPSSCLLYTSPSPRDISGSRMPSSA